MTANGGTSCLSRSFRRRPRRTLIRCSSSICCTPRWSARRTRRSSIATSGAIPISNFARGSGSCHSAGEASQPQLLPEAKNGFSLDDAGRHAPTAAPRDGSKLALIIDLLQRADGASIVDLTQATGWLAHTTRAAITGLRKRGYAVIRERIGAGESVYRISGAPDDSGDRVAVQTEAVDGRRAFKPKTKRAA